MKTKRQLKDVFKGLSSILFQNTPIFGDTGTEATAEQLKAISLAPDYDLPVHVDDLGLSQGEPTVNHYKIFGDNADWTATSTQGDFDMNLLIPSISDDVLKLCYGADSVKEVEATLAANSGAGAAATNWEGSGLSLDGHEVRGTVVLLNERKDRMLIVSNFLGWATPVFENASTEPVAFRLTGTIESSDGPDILFLKKKVA